MSVLDITALEPRLGALLEEAAQEARQVAGLDDLYARYKAQLGRLVGFCAANKKLRDPMVYEAALRALCDAIGY